MNFSKLLVLLKSNLKMQTYKHETTKLATKFIVTFLPLRLCYVNTSTCFSKDADNLTTYGYML